VGIYYNPNPPHIGAQQPPDQRKLTPPQSGPVPQNPPFSGSRIAQAVLVCWAAAVVTNAIAPIIAVNLDPPISGPAATAPLFKKINYEIYRTWEPQSAAPIIAVNLDPPISGPVAPGPLFKRANYEIYRAWEVPQSPPFAPNKGLVRSSSISLSVSRTVQAFTRAETDVVIVSGAVSRTNAVFTRAATLRRGDTTAGLIFKGMIGQVTINKRGLVTFEARGPMTQARGIINEHFCQACRADVYDSRCKVDKTGFATTVTVAIVVNSQTFTVVSAASKPTGWFNQGPGVAAAGDPFQIKTWDLPSLTVTTMGAIDLIIAPGDVLTIYKGCDKSSTMCVNDFNNIANGRMEEFAPGRDLALTTST
jgi:uncharacterized phage protein (TIGR02218 family)